MHCVVTFHNLKCEILCVEARDLKVMCGIKPVFAEYWVILHSKMLTSSKPLLMFNCPDTFPVLVLITGCRTWKDLLDHVLVCVSETCRVNSFTSETIYTEVDKSFFFSIPFPCAYFNTD